MRGLRARLSAQEAVLDCRNKAALAHDPSLEMDSMRAAVLTLGAYSHDNRTATATMRPTKVVFARVSFSSSRIEFASNL